MFNRLTDKAKVKSQWYRTGDRLPIQMADSLLANQRYCFYIEQVKGLANLPEEHFSSFYHSFLKRFSEFVQVLPDAANAPLASLFINGLLRGLNTLHLFVQLFEDSSPLERFALFTACVLRDISFVMTEQKVLITDDKGITLSAWQPFCGPMTEVLEGTSFKILPMASSYKRIGRSIRVALARQVLGEHGFMWIASDLRLFTEWVEALDDEDEEGSGRLAKVIQRYRREGGGLVDGLPADWIDIMDSPETELADQFYAWLVDGLEKGTIKSNSADSFVHITELGVFVEVMGLSKDFSEAYNVLFAQQTIFAHLRNFVGAMVSGRGDLLSVQLLSNYPDSGAARGSNFLSGKSQLREGVLLDTSIVFPSGKATEVTSHMKIPSSMRQSSQDIAAFNEMIKPNTTMKNR